MRIANAPEVGDPEMQALQQARLLALGMRTMTLPLGRGALTLGQSHLVCYMYVCMCVCVYVCMCVCVYVVCGTYIHTCLLHHGTTLLLHVCVLPCSPALQQRIVSIAYMHCKSAEAVHVFAGSTKTFLAS